MHKTLTVHAFMEEAYGYSQGAPEDETWKKAWRPVVKMVKHEDSDTLVYLSTFNINVELPDDFDPVPAQVRGIRKKMEEALEQYQRTVAECKARLAELEALTFEGTVTTEAS